ncbi:MAG: squalene/phytoene synthase family protein [Rhizobiaceae bacterium]|nr:squalene/phytoene synthase family protein [Rhizobiaceae bacterium]
MDGATFVRDFVRQNDPDRFFASLFAPADKRDALLALAAFDAEIASLRGKVREPMAGEIRIRWWQDRIEAEGAIASGNPIADALAATIKTHGLPKSAFATYLDARLFDLYDDGFPTRGDLEAYCGETSGIMLQLSALILDRDAATRAADACGHGGCLRTITQALRWRSDPARLRPSLPGDLLAALGLDRAQFGETGHEEASRAAIEGAQAIAREHRDAFLAAVSTLPETLRPAFIALAPAAASARQGRAPGGPLRRQWQMLKVALCGWPPR